MSNKYTPLFEEVTIGKVRIKNRIGMASMGTNAEEPNGILTERQIRYYEERAKGGTSLIITEGQFITRITDPGRAGQDGLDTAKQAAQWGKIAAAAHKYNAKVAVQLMCGLGFLSVPVPGGPQPTSVCETPNFNDPNVICRELTKEEIRSIVASFGRSAGRAVAEGVDMIEINAHLGYLVDEFMTPLWNHRTDEYGGNFENRMRFPREIYEAVRGAAGPDVPIIFKIGVWHDLEGGRTFEEGVEICRYLEGLGVDAIDVNIGQHLNEKHAVPYVYEADGFGAEYCGKLKKEIHIPILCAGKQTPETALAALEAKQADMILFGRQLIADPELANKLLDDRREDIRPCMSCNQLCLGGFYLGQPVSCAGNAAAGHEIDYCITKTDAPKRVVVVGGGPGGMEAARVAALRGHQVTLYEKSEKLGGELNPASVPRFKWKVAALRDWMIRQLNHLGVKVVYNAEIHADSPELRKADRIIVALGAKPAVIPIKGCQNNNVVEVTDAHENPSKVKGSKIVVCGGGMSGCDCALDYAMEGKDVTVIEMTGSLIPGEVVYSNRLETGYAFEKYGVKSLTDTKVLEFTDQGVVVENRDGIQTILADTIITAFGMAAESKLADEICSWYSQAVAIGECHRPGGQIGGAIRSGFEAACQI